jgi:broad specificity phosphatase PhoE
MPLPIPHQKFLFLRHGQTEWNHVGRIQGRTDVPLNSTGLAQAQQAAQALAGTTIHTIIASPLQRAWATAGLVQQVVQAPLVADANLQEGSFGAFEGRHRLDILAEYGLQPHESWASVIPPDAEPWPALQARAAVSVARHLAENPGKTVLFVGHGAWFSALAQHLGLPHQLRYPNAQPLAVAPAWQLTNLAGQAFSG